MDLDPTKMEADADQLFSVDCYVVPRLYIARDPPEVMARVGWLAEIYDDEARTVNEVEAMETVEEVEHARFDTPHQSTVYEKEVRLSSCFLNGAETCNRQTADVGRPKVIRVEC